MPKPHVQRSEAARSRPAAAREAAHRARARGAKWLAAPLAAPLAALLTLATLSALACAPEDAAAHAPDGEGLVILPYDGPLAHGVTTRDARLYYHDFGRVPDGQVVTRVFRLRNSDPRPVRILRVDPSCGCTGAELSKVGADGTRVKGRPIRSRLEGPEDCLLAVAPGEVAEVELQISTGSLVTKNADKLVNVRLTTDSPNGFYLTLEAHILVEKPFAVVPGTLAFGNVPENGGGRAKVEIVPAGHFTYELGALTSVPEGVHAVLTREIRNAAPIWTLEAELEPPLARGLRMETLRIATEEAPGVPGHELEVPLLASIVSDFSAEPERIVFAAPRDATVRSGSDFRSLLSGHRLRVTGIELPEEHRGYLAASLVPEEPSADGASPRWRIELETVPPLPDDEELLTGELLLTLDDPQHPSHVLPYVVHLRPATGTPAR